jgi:hypothetical protein
MDIRKLVKIIEDITSKEVDHITDHFLGEVLQASLIPWSSIFKDGIMAKLKKMSPEELQYVLDGVKWQRKGLLFKAWLEALLKLKNKSKH